MSKFFNAAFDASKVDSDPIVDPVVDPVQDALSTDEPVLTPDPAVVDEPVQDEPVVDTPAAPTAEKKKVVIDVNEYLQNHQETVLKVLQEKSTDYSKMDNATALRVKLKNENPEWSDDDVTDELNDRYAVGKEKIVVDPENMDEDQIAAAKEHNKSIDAATRLLKKDGKDAKTQLAEAVATLALPEFEYEVDADAPVDVESLMATRAQEFEEGMAKTRNEVWIPALTTAINTVDAISEEISYEADGLASTIKVDLSLTKEDKEAILKELAVYQASPDDEKYMDGDVVDYPRFIKDKSEVIQRKKMYSAIAKQAAEKATQDYIRKNVVNYTTGVRNVASPASQTTDPALGIWKNNKNSKK